jgi:hypothetical protein
VAAEWLACSALVTLTVPGSAVAQFFGNASANSEFQSNSNVFDLNSGQSLPAGIGAQRRSDTYYEYGAQIGARYDWRRQEFFVTASASEYKYQHYTFLDHYAYNIETGLLWALGPRLDGKVDVVRTRTMVPFYDLVGFTPTAANQPVTTLSLVTDQRETADVNYRLTSKWKLVGSASADRITQPVVGAPDLELYQNSAMAGFDYMGVTGLTSGVRAQYLEGEYLGATGAFISPRFSQETANFVAKYKKYRTTFDGAFGYSRRSSANSNDTTSGITGLIELVEQFTPRTSVTLKADRSINNYLVNSGAEIDSDLGATLLWQATYKSAFTLGYSFSYRDFAGQGNNPIGSKRVDIQEVVTAGIEYHPRRWLLIRPYYTVQTRRSTLIGNHYSSSIFGVSVTVSTPDKKPAVAR